MDAAEKVKLLRFALRAVELDEREERVIGWAGQIWDQEAVEIVCSLLEQVREAGFLEREGRYNEEGMFVHRQPGDWDWSASGSGSAYIGGDREDPGPMPHLDTP